LNGVKCLWIGDCNDADNASCDYHNNRDGILYTWGASTLNFVCTFLAGWMQRDRDVVYVTVAYTLAPVLTTIIFVVKPLMGDYYEAPSNLAVMATLITLIAGITYKALTLAGEHYRAQGSKSCVWTTHSQICSIERFRLQPYLLGENDINVVNFADPSLVAPLVSPISTAKGNDSIDPFL